MIVFKKYCPMCNARVGDWMRGCSGCGKVQSLVDRLGKPCKICHSTTNVICIHNTNFEIRDKNGVYLSEDSDY